MNISSKFLENALTADRDPIFSFFVYKVRLPKIAILFIMLTINGISLFGGGWFISYYLYPNANIIRVFDASHLYNGLVQAFFVFPIVIVLYFWQPLERQIAGMIMALKKNRSIVENSEDLNMNFLKSQRRSIILLSLSCALVFILVQHLLVYPIENAKTGTPFFWYYAKYYYWLLYTPILFWGYYMIGSVLVKMLFILSWLSRFLKNVVVDVHPLHPDGAGGLGSIGELSIKLSSVFVALGFLASILVVARLSIGSGWFYLDTALEYILYLMFAPISLVAPMWSVHKKMLEERDAILLTISREFEEHLSKRNSKSSGEALGKENARLNELNEKYKLVMETYPTWPLRVNLFRNFSVTAVIPFVTGTISLGLDLLNRTP
jgi:hypothetical protein